MKKALLFLLAILLVLPFTASAVECYVLGPLMQADDYGDPYAERTYSLTLEGDEAFLTETVSYSDHYASSTAASGTYTRQGDMLWFCVPGDRAGKKLTYYVAYFGEDGLSSVLSNEFERGAGVLPGVYHGTDAEMGALELTVSPDMTARMTSDKGRTYSGGIGFWDGACDFLFFDEETFESADWRITADGDTFEHTDFNLALYAPYAGTYPMTGDLGGIMLEVDTLGFACAYVQIEGRRVFMDGSISVNLTDGVIDGFSLYTMDGQYWLSAQMTKLPEGLWNYYGSLSVTLAAG